VSEKTFAVPMQLRLSIAQALNAIRESLKQLEARNKDAAIAYQNQSLSALNESIAHLLQTSQNVQSSNTGMGFDEFMKQMEQLASMQEMVNQKTQGLASGALSPEQQALLQRIAQDQEIIRKSIEQLQREMQGKGSIEQRLNQMNNEMQEVTKNLNNKAITERTLELQERILSRMLDAQRSVNRRDFSNKRTSETAKSYEVNDPGALPASLGEHIRILDAELMKALQEGYTKDFETVIKQYFENLNKQNIQLPIKKE
jgi:predicted RNase H-like nuclease (RuvC/YqgF family)